MEKIRVLLVDDQALIREGITMMLSLYEEIHIVGEASNGEEALNLIEELNENIDIILMDIRMPKINGVEGTKIIKEKYPSLKIIILTTFNEDKYIFECLKNGADGYILKDVKSEEIVKGIKTVYSGNVLLQPEIATKVVNAFKDNSNLTSRELNDCKTDVKTIGKEAKVNEDESKNINRELVIKGKYETLTPREIEIALLVSKGKANKEISNQLYITEGTVKNHLTKILNKLELENRTQLALFINDNYNNGYNIIKL